MNDHQIIKLLCLVVASTNAALLVLWMLHIRLVHAYNRHLAEHHGCWAKLRDGTEWRGGKIVPNGEADSDCCKGGQ